MSTERHEELAALHALGLLEGEERRTFEAELSGDQGMRSLMDSLLETSAALAAQLPPAKAPAGLRQRILDECRPPVSSPPPAQGVVTPFPLRHSFPWAAAAVLGLGTAWFAFETQSLRTANEALRTQQRLAEIAYESARGQLAERSLLAEQMINELGGRLRRSEDLARLKVSALASLAGNTAEARAIAVWDPDQRAGLLTLANLPAIKPDQDYQIWVIDPAIKDPVSGGVFHVGQAGEVSLAFRPDQPVGAATAFAISLERKGGVPKAEGPVLLLGRLPAY